MPYTGRFDGPRHTPEERDVAAALKAYSDDPRKGATAADWVPTAALYQTYRRWFAHHCWRRSPDEPRLLTLRQFGRAVRRVFPLAWRCYRYRTSKSHVRGYAGLIGPESLTSSGRGRRRIHPITTDRHGYWID
jgi:hypothetical protein